MKDFSKFSAIIIGAGDATGAALTKKFASHGYKVCPARRPRSIEKVNKLADEINNSGGWAKGLDIVFIFIEFDIIPIFIVFDIMSACIEFILILLINTFLSFR